MKVTIGLYSDAMTPSIQCLMLQDAEGDGVRLTSAKGCGTWNLIKLFKCNIELDDLMQYEEAAR